MLSEILTMEKCDFLKTDLNPPKTVIILGLTASFLFVIPRGRSSGAMVLGKLPLPGRPTYLDYSRARAYCAYSRCGWGLFGHLFSYLSFLFSFSLSLGDGPI